LRAFSHLILETFFNISDLQADLDSKRSSGASIGFVPTMGALHKGHISLLNESKEKCDVTVCSIFVNPTQFNDPKDYQLYPRNTETDKKILEEAGCDCLFMPSVDEMYPSEDYKHISFDPGRLGQILEGAHRPGHFAGMVSVVKRLLDIVMPDKAFFGQKDYQQYLIVHKMVEYYKLPLEIVKCDTVREDNGLAMSSRNQRLSQEEREKASLIYKTLTWAKHEINAGKLNFETIISQAMFDLTEKGDFKVDYFDICGSNSLEHVGFRRDNEKLVALTAVWIRDIRLIDNLLV
jgi:pantoate--beta-alanine ligase